MRVPAVSLLLLPLLLSPLSGCLDSGPEGGHEGGLTALEAREVADRRARAWDDGAELVALLSVESRGPNETVEGAPPDAVFADGRMDAYSFYYEANGTQEAWNVTVGGDGRVLFEGPEDFDGEGGSISDWRVDSPRLMGVLRDEVDGFAQRADDGVAEAYLAVLAEDLEEDDLEFDGTAWVVLEFADDVYLHAVDAGNGTLLYSQSFRFALDLEGAEWGSFDGTLTLAGSRAEHRVALASDHGRVGFRLEASAGTPGDTVVLNVTDPSGASHEATLSVGAPGDDVVLYVEPAPEGTWTATLQLTGVAVDYTLEYCTSGIDVPFSPFGGGSPCGRVDP